MYKTLSDLKVIAIWLKRCELYVESKRAFSRNFLL